MTVPDRLRMACSGVRISWDMLARKLDLTCAAVKGPHAPDSHLRLVDGVLG